MEETPFPALNTREFVARWHSVVEEHLVVELTHILRDLAAAEPGGLEPGAEPSVGLARHVAYALQVAGSSNGGVQAALQYLQQAVAIRQEVPESS